jgi:hypothetical protein
VSTDEVKSERDAASDSLTLLRMAASVYVGQATSRYCELAGERARVDELGMVAGLSLRWRFLGSQCFVVRLAMADCERRRVG